MKKRRRWISILVIAAALLCGTAAAAEQTGMLGDLSWTLDDEGVLVISGDGDIPDMGDGVSIWADSPVPVLNAVIESGVTGIGFSAFSGCESLTGVSIADSVNRIDGHAFHGCRNLREISIPDGVTRIGSQVFKDCVSLKSVSFPDSVTRIDSYVFDGCTNLTDVAFGSGEAWIEANTFYGPDRTSDLPSFTTIVVSPDNPYYRTEGGVLYSRDGTRLICCPSGRKDYAIPAGVTVIAERALFWNASLTNFVIPDGVTFADSEAFCGCVNMTSVSVPFSLKRLGDYVFLYCDNLKDVYYGGTEELWERYFIDEYDVGNQELRKAALHCTTGIISYGSCGENASWSVTGLGMLTITGTGAMTDYNTDSDVPWYEFRSSVKTASIGEGITSIGESAFCRCANMTEISVPDTVVRIRNGAFRGCSSLKTVVLPEGLTSIGSGAFSDCLALERPTIPDSVDSIGYGAFSYSHLTGIAIPDGVSRIEGSTFESCEFLKEIIIPGSVTEIGPLAFYDCRALTDIWYEGTETDWTAIIFENSFIPEDAAVHFITARYILTLPESVTVIGSEAFAGLGKGYGIMIPPNVTYIAEDAFKGTKIVVTAPAGSYAAQWAEEHGIDRVEP